MSTLAKGALLAFILGYSYGGAVDFFDGESFKGWVIDAVVEGVR